MSLMFGEPEPDEPKGKGKGKGKKGGGGGGMDMMMQMMGMMMGCGDMMGGKGGKGKAAMRVAAGERVYSGKVRKYSEEFGNGMIFCEELFWETGEEVYVHKSTLDEAQAVVGDDIAFFVHYNAKGQAQASRPCMRIGIGQEGALALKGWYKSKEGAAFGFIDCPETMAYFGRDVYVNKDLVEGLAQGTCVAFNINLNGDGMPNASLICHCEETYQPPAGELTTGELESPKGGKGKQGKVGMLMMMMGKGPGGPGKGMGPAPTKGAMARPPAPPSANQEPSLTAAELSKHPVPVQKQMIGERLYRSVQKYQPALAAKLTGMMLEMENAELLMLLESEARLKRQIDQAMEVLN